MSTYNNISCGSKSCDFEPPCICINSGVLTVTNYHSDYSGALIINNATGSKKRKINYKRKNHEPRTNNKST